MFNYGGIMNIRENLNKFVTITAYRGTKPVCTWAKCTRGDDTHYWRTVESEDLTGPEINPVDLAGVLEVLEDTGVRIDFSNHSAY